MRSARRMRRQQTARCERLSVLCVAPSAADSGFWKIKKTPAQHRTLARQIYDELYAKDRRKLGRRKADTKWKSDSSFDLKRETASDKIAVELVRGWLQGKSGKCPGYCFCSDAVLAIVIGKSLNLHGTDRGLLVKIKNRLRLKKGEILWVLRQGQVTMLK